MIKEADSAIDKGQRAHRIASILVWSIWVILAFIHGDHAVAIRTGLFFLLPLAGIWFPEALASYTGVTLAKGRYIDKPSHPIFLKWACWWLLVFVPLFLLWLRSK